MNAIKASHLTLVIMLAVVSSILVGCGGSAPETAASPLPATMPATKAVEPKADASKATVVMSGEDGTKMTIHEDGSMTAESSEGKMEMTQDSMKMTSKEGQVTATVGTAAKLPDDFPKDLPQYTKGTLGLVSESKEEGSLLVQWKTPDPVADVLAFFEKSMKDNGWTIQQRMDNPAPGQTMSMLHCVKEGRAAVVVVTRQNDETEINLSQSKE